MSLTAGEIEAVVAELRPLAGARVDAVRVHAERALTLDLRGPAGEVTLLVSAEPDVTRLHAAGARPPQPETPWAFQGLLRKELLGARLAALRAVPGDRVVELSFDRAAGPLGLVAELTGRHGNLFLVDGGGIIRASAARNLSQRRRLAAGEPYLAPAPRPEGAGAPAEGARFAPVPGVPFPLSAAIEARYREREEARALGEARRRLREPVRAALASARRARERLAEEAGRVPAAEHDRRVADLLKQNLHALRRGMAEAVLTEWTEDGPRQLRVALDPALPPRENMERWYRRYRRIADSAARVAARDAEVAARQAALGALAAEIDGAALERLPRLEKEARRLGAAPRRAAEPGRRRRREEPLPPYRTFRSLSGASVLVGRGAEANDALTLRVARGNDLWLHARGRTGAHVVIRLGKGEGPDQDTLLDAAHLAVHFSDARGEPQAEVDYTRAKHVRKPKGAAAGAVTYSQERVLLLRAEPARLERLLGEEDG